MGKVVIMAEKRNAGEDIAKALKISNITSSGNYHFIKGILEGDDVTVVWSNGHCLQLLDPIDIDPKYKVWNEADLPIPFDDKALAIIPSKAGLFRAIKEELNDANTIINAGDAGREGELIQRWILDHVYKVKKTTVYRLWAQSLTEKAICSAYNHLLGLDEKEENTLNDLYDSGRARAIMDKYLGYNYSRLISKTKTDGYTINYGRCKSPLTHAIIERDLEIENFKPVPFSYINIVLAKDENHFKATLVGKDNKRLDFNSESEAKATIDKIGSSVDVATIKRDSKIQTPPQLYDILNIQKEMAKKFNYEADETLALCQSLYDKHHLLSYPRTDSRFLTTDLKPEIQEHLNALNFGQFKKYVEKAQGSFIPDKYFNDAKVADHHALIPVVPDGDMEEKYNALSEEEKNVFNYIAKSFIALWLPNYEYETMEAKLKNDAYTFIAKGKSDKTLGWKEIYTNDVNQEDEEKEDEQKIVQLTEGESLDISDKLVINSKTKPKSKFTTASLLDYMKVNHIGTGATRDGIIKELTEKKGQNTDSAVKKDGKYFTSTSFGRKMDKVIPDDIKSIDYLAGLERQLEDIAEGKLGMKDFISSIDADFKEKKNLMINNKESVLVKENPNQVESKFKCKVCGQPLIDKGWGYSCKGWKKDGTGCDFSIGKNYSGKKLSDKVINQLLNDGITKSTLKLNKKAGGTYEAYLTFVNEDGKWKIKPSFK